MKRLSEIADKTRFLFSDQITFEDKAVEKVLRKNDGFAMLEEVRTAFEALGDFGAESIETSLRELCERKSVKFKNVAQPLRVAMTGTTVSPPIQDTLAVLGRDRVLARIDIALKLRQPA